MSKVILIIAALLSVCITLSASSSGPSDIMEVAEWTRKIIISYVDSQKVEKVFDDTIKWDADHQTAWYTFKMDVSVRRKDGSIYVLYSYIFLII